MEKIKSEFIISGNARREIKKELSELKHFVRDFWQHHYLDKDMHSFYGGEGMSDEDAQKMYDEKILKISRLESLLNEKIE